MEILGPLFTALGIIFGLAIGSHVAERKWSKNAEQPFRIEYKGRLYKVSYADDKEAQ